MDTIIQVEKRLAVVTNWSLWGSFGLCFILSGFSKENMIFSLLGYSLIIVGFSAHIIVNRIYKTTFSKGEVVVGFVIFGVSIISFIVSWLTSEKYADANVLSGIIGFGAVVLGFVVYLVTKYGLKGSFSMFHEMHHD